MLTAAFCQVSGYVIEIILTDIQKTEGKKQLCDLNFLEKKYLRCTINISQIQNKTLAHNSDLPYVKWYK